MKQVEDEKENILHILEGKCYMCGRTKTFFDDIYKEDVLKQYSLKVKEKFYIFWNACETELVNTNLIKEWIKYLDTAIDKISIDKYSDLDMWTLSGSETFQERIPHLPLFIHFHRKHFQSNKGTKLEEVVDYLLNVKSILIKFNKDLSVEDLKIVIDFFKEFYESGDILYGWRNYAVECYRKNQRRSNCEVDITAKNIFKEIKVNSFSLPFYYYLSELKIQKSIVEGAFEFPNIDISLNFGDYKQTLRVFLCPICEEVVTKICTKELEEFRRCYVG